MSFLTPLYIAGTLFVALPIIFHLIRRTPRDRVPFSSLMFLRESPPRVTRRSRLENLLLLLLRAGALTVLACAFARPFLREPLRADVDSGNVRVIAIVLDTSASMRRDELWTQARARASRAIEELRPIDHAAVFAFDRHVRTLLSFDEWLDMAPGERANRLKDLLNSVEPTWSATHVGAALAAAADAVDSHAASIASSGTEPEQRVVLISDMQKGSDLAGLRQFDWPERVTLDMGTVSPQRQSNATIQLVEDRDEERVETGKVRVRIANAADSKRELFRLTWSDANVALTEVYLPAGKSRTLQVPAPATDASQQLVLDGDEQEFDNRLFIVPRNRERVSVLFAGGGQGEDTANLLYYFERAFPDTPWRSVQVTSHEGADHISPADLAAVRFAVLADSVPEDKIQVFRDFVGSGGTLLSVMTSSATADSFGRVLGIERWSADEASLREYAMLGEIDFQHPLFAPFSDPGYGDFTNIHFWRHRRIDLERLGNCRVLVRFDDHDPALVEITRGQGRMFILTAGWHPTDSQLAVSSKFVPLLGGMLDLAAGAREAMFSAYVDDPVLLDERNRSATRVARPDGTEDELPAGTRSFTGTSQPGIYTMTSDGVNWQFAVNLHPSESQTDPLPIEDLEQLGVGLTTSKSSSRIVADRVQQRQMHAFELESRQKLWRWLVLVVLAVLFIETWLAGRT